MKKKKVCLNIAGSGDPQVKDLELVKGSSLKDLKKAADVPKSYQVTRKATGEQLQDGQDLFSLLEENELLLATPPSTVGSGRGIMSRLFSFFEPKVRVLETYPQTGMTQPSHEPIPVSPQNIRSPVLVKPTVSVMPPEMLGANSELENMGWRMYGNEFHGFVFDKHGNRYVAKLVKGFRGHSLYVRNPPPHVFQGLHGRCFRPVGDGWYWVHFNEGGRYPPGMIRSLQDTFNSDGRLFYA